VFTLFMALTFVFGLAACGESDPTPIPVNEINALGKFADGKDGVYTLDINSNNAFSLTFDKTEFSYANVMKALTGDFTEMKALNITLQVSGVSILVKLQNKDGIVAKEVQINANQMHHLY